MSIIMVALSHYCCRTTLQCQCHVSQAKEQSQYLSATVQWEHKIATVRGDNGQSRGKAGSGWRRGVVVSGVRRMNEVNARRAG